MTADPATRDALHGLLRYPVVSASLLVALLWPWSRALPPALVRVMAGARDDAALAAASLRLRIWRLRLRVKPFALRDSPLLLPLLAPFASRPGRRHGRPGLRARCAALLPALRYAPLSNVAIAHGWYRPAPRRRPALYLDAWMRNEALLMLWCLGEGAGRWPPLHFDKRELARRCEKEGLAHIPTLAVFRAGSTEESGPGGFAFRGDLFAKPAVGAAGRGTEAWRWRAREERFQSSRGDSATPAQLLERLRAQSASGPTLLLQPRLRNHPEIRAVTSSEALCCVRVISCRFPDGELALVPGWCVLKVAPPGAIVDNVAGGDSVRLVADPETGVLRTPGGEPVPADDAGAPTRIPFWEETKALCRRAHASAFQTFPIVAWDVALTPDGPVLVEGNATYMGPGTLSTTGPYCGEGPVVRCLLEHLCTLDRRDLRTLRRAWAARDRSTQRH